MSTHFKSATFIALALILPLVHASASAACSGGPSTTFSIRGAVENPKVFDVATLATYQSSKETVSYYSGSSGLVTQTYIGVPLYDLLNDAVVKTDPTRKNDILRNYLVVNATDCYQAVVAVAEIQPANGHQLMMVAYATVDAAGAVQPLSGSEGAFRLIVPGDKAGARLVSNLNRITVRSAP